MFWGLDHSCLRTGLSVAFRGLSPYALLSSTLVIDHYEDEQLAVACNIGEDVAVFSKLIRRRLWRRIVGDTSRNNRINAPIPGGRAARKSYVCARRGSRSGTIKPVINRRHAFRRIGDGRRLRRSWLDHITERVGDLLTFTVDVGSNRKVRCLGSGGAAAITCQSTEASVGVCCPSASVSLRISDTASWHETTTDACKCRFIRNCL